MGWKATGAQAEIEIPMAQVSRNTFQSNGGSSNPSLHSSWGMKITYLFGKKDGETKLDKEYLPLSAKDCETENPRATNELRVSVVGDNL
ncbi:hypothetical protein H5410_057448 [Solanum commersonii]|uniref:Uncharacterized protein n=1 Tax=Solanum commersonii TaxID=4109 RepID=A0A9J5WP18_SOLCO|nr:hypothetical protein H5410_057448 [Solanum commersonii]